MDPSHVIWSATDCPSPGMGLYYGLSSASTHCTVAQWLLPKRGAVYPGGTVCVRPREPWPLIYYAVRDPSAMRVVPVRGVSAPKVLKPVSLVFQLKPGTPADAANGPFLADLAAHVGDVPHAGFVITVGLAKDAESEFHRRSALEAPDQPYEALCDRLQEIGREFGPRRE